MADVWYMCDGCDRKNKCDHEAMYRKAQTEIASLMSQIKNRKNWLIPVGFECNMFKRELAPMWRRNKCLNLTDSKEKS